jgi:hypothetical protein
VKVAIITPYSKEALPYLQRGHKSVLDQTHKDVRHFMIAADEPNPIIDKWDCVHIKLPKVDNSDYSDIVRSMAASIVAAQDFDAMCILHPESWYDKDHVEEMLDAAKRYGTSVVTCPRNIFKTDNSFMYVDAESDGIGWNDMSTYMFLKDKFFLLRSLSFNDKSSVLIADKILWKEIVQSKLPVGRSLKATVNSTTVFAHHYLRIDEEPPEFSRILVQVDGKNKIIYYKNYLDILEAQKKLKEKQEENNVRTE